MIAAAFPYRLYLVIAQANCGTRDFLEVAEQAILGGVDIIQLREKNLDTGALLQKALQLKSITDKYQVPLIINDNLQVAKEVNAFGIHVGNSDLSPVQIRKEWEGCHCLGYSIEHLQQLHYDETAVSDCLGISPVFTTNTKKDTLTEWGLQGIAHIRSLTDKPLIAIGNMNQDNVTAVLEAGADCIAVVSAICAAADPRKAAYELKNAIVKSL